MSFEAESLFQDNLNLRMAVRHSEVNYQRMLMKGV
jgi:hypothetical protein